MLPRTFFAIIISLNSCALALHVPRSKAQCSPFHTTFPASSVSRSNSANFVGVSPEGSYRSGNGGLELILQKPAGVITTKAGVNSQIAEGATVNSTFTLLYGKVTFEVSSPLVGGVVTAVILLADEHDEIDVELLGGDPSHWQTNIFVPTTKDKEPLWGVFSSIEDVPSNRSSEASIKDFHQYTIDWSADRIVWTVDGKITRTLMRDDTKKNGELHFPSHPARIQLGIWDASSPVGTAAWAKGPINWKESPEKMTAVVRSITVECMNS